MSQISSSIRDVEIHSKLNSYAQKSNKKLLQDNKSNSKGYEEKTKVAFFQILTPGYLINKISSVRD